jgi:hypothetical protein
LLVSGAELRGARFTAPGEPQILGRAESAFLITPVRTCPLSRGEPVTGGEIPCVPAGFPVQVLAPDRPLRLRLPGPGVCRIELRIPFDVAPRGPVAFRVEADGEPLFAGRLEPGPASRTLLLARPGGRRQRVGTARRLLLRLPPGMRRLEIAADAPLVCSVRQLDLEPGIWQQSAAEGAASLQVLACAADAAGGGVREQERSGWEVLSFAAPPSPLIPAEYRDLELRILEVAGACAFDLEWRRRAVGLLAEVAALDLPPGSPLRERLAAPLMHGLDWMPIRQAVRSLGGASPPERRLFLSSGDRLRRALAGDPFAGTPRTFLRPGREVSWSLGPWPEPAKLALEARGVLFSAPPSSGPVILSCELSVEGSAPRVERLRVGAGGEVVLGLGQLPAGLRGRLRVAVALPESRDLALWLRVGVRRPEGSRTFLPPAQREYFAGTRRRPVVLTKHGPTVLRLRLVGEPGEERVSLTVDGVERTVELPAAEEGEPPHVELLLPLAGEGQHEVRLAPEGVGRLLVAADYPQLAPPYDPARARLEATRGRPSPAELLPPLGLGLPALRIPGGPEGETARRAENWTVWSRVRRAYVDLEQAPDTRWDAGLRRRGLLLGRRYRLGLLASRNLTRGSNLAGLELRLEQSLPAGLRAALRGSAWQQLGTPRAAIATAILELEGSWRWSPAWRLLPHVEIGVRGRDAPPAGSETEVDSRVWSTYKEAHPCWLNGELELRLEPRPGTRWWLDGAAYSTRDFAEIEQLRWSAGRLRRWLHSPFMARFFWSGRRYRAAGSRKTAFTRQELDLELTAGWWLRSGDRLELLTGGAWFFEPRAEWTALLGIRYHLGLGGRTDGRFLSDEQPLRWEADADADHR